MRIYLAGPLFTAAEREWNRRLAACLREAGHDVRLPQEFPENQPPFNPLLIYRKDALEARLADAVVAWLDGPDPDSGTCWEHGYKLGLGGRVLGYTTDLRFQNAMDGSHDLNLMVTQSAPILRFSPDVTPERVADAVHAFLKTCK